MLTAFECLHRLRRRPATSPQLTPRPTKRLRRPAVRQASRRKPPQPQNPVAPSSRSGSPDLPADHSAFPEDSLRHPLVPPVLANAPVVPSEPQRSQRSLRQQVVSTVPFAPCTPPVLPATAQLAATSTTASPPPGCCSAYPVFGASMQVTTLPLQPQLPDVSRAKGR